jgi:hypothetical protein
MSLRYRKALLLLAFQAVGWRRPCQKLDQEEIVNFFHLFLAPYFLPIWHESWSKPQEKIPFIDYPCMLHWGTDEFS